MELRDLTVAKHDTIVDRTMYQELTDSVRSAWIDRDTDDRKTSITKRPLKFIEPCHLRPALTARRAPIRQQHDLPTVLREIEDTSVDVAKPTTTPGIVRLIGGTRSR